MNHGNSFIIASLAILIMFVIFLIQNRGYQKVTALTDQLAPLTTSIKNTPYVPPTPTDTYKNTEEIPGFQYPNSKHLKTYGRSIVLGTDDSANVVTDWYKNKIKEKGMQVTSFVQTNTNGNILNKLMGSGNSREISVVISQENKDEQTRIVLTMNF